MILNYKYLIISRAFFLVFHFLNRNHAPRYDNQEDDKFPVMSNTLAKTLIKIVRYKMLKI